MTFTPICVACRREMRCRRNGYFFTEYEGAAVWAGDMYECESCKHQVVVGVARKPTVEAHEVGFERVRAAHSQFELTRGNP